MQSASESFFLAWKILWCYETFSVFIFSPKYLLYSGFCNIQPHNHCDRFRWHGCTVLHSYSFHSSLNIRLHTCCSDKLFHVTISKNGKKTTRCCFMLKKITIPFKNGLSHYKSNLRTSVLCKDKKIRCQVSTIFVHRNWFQ